MDAHFICIPSLTPLTTRGLPRGDLQALSRETDWALHAEVLALRTLDELLADLFEALDLARCQGDADLVDFLSLIAFKMSASYSSERSCRQEREEQRRTGPSPKSFSGFWYDILPVERCCWILERCGMEISEYEAVANHDLNSWVR